MLGLQVWTKSSVRKMAAVQEQYMNLLLYNIRVTMIMVIDN